MESHDTPLAVPNVESPVGAGPAQDIGKPCRRRDRGIIIRRSQVRVLPPLPLANTEVDCSSTVVLADPVGMPRGHGKHNPPWVQQHGNGWRGWVPDGGKQRRGPVMSTAAEAYEWARLERENGPSAAGRVTLERAMGLVRGQLELADRRAGTAAWYECQFKALLAAWPARTPLARIGKRELEAFIRARRASGASGGTIRHHLRALARLFSVCREAGLVRGDAPTSLVTLPRVEPAAPRGLAFDEVESVLARVRAWSRMNLGSSGHSWAEDPAADADLIELLFRTGLRRTEAAWVRLEDWGGGELRVEHGKRRRRELPMPAALERLLRRMAPTGAGAEWLVPGEGEAARVATVGRVVGRWRKKLKEPRLTPHALRHSFGTHLDRSGIEEKVIASLLGHSRETMTAHYLGGVAWDARLRGMSAAWTRVKEQAPGGAS